jgi:hypothetical protein
MELRNRIELSTRGLSVNSFKFPNLLILYNKLNLYDINSKAFSDFFRIDQILESFSHMGSHTADMPKKKG